MRLLVIEECYSRVSNHSILLLHATRLNCVIQTSVHSISTYQFFIFDNLCQNKYLRNFYKNLYCLVISLYLFPLLSFCLRCTSVQLNNYYIPNSQDEYIHFIKLEKKKKIQEWPQHSMAQIKKKLSNPILRLRLKLKSLSFACKFTAIIICKMQITR